jgi:Asp/Glu/hydantoin racemase
MTKRIAMLHTSFVFINTEPVFTNLFKELLPDVQVIDFVDSDVLAAVNREGGINQGHCSSLGPSMDVARKLVRTPIIKIDDAMTRKAAEMASTIGVMATLPTTLKPTIDLILENAEFLSKTVTVKQHLCEGAFKFLMSGERATHDQIVLDGARKLSPEVEIIVLAQASMSRLAPMLAQEIGKDVLSSPRLAVEYVKSLLE